MARFCAAAQIVLILLGGGAAQYPYLVEPALTITTAAADPLTLHLLIGALIIGVAILLPSFGYLYWLFDVATGPGAHSR